MITTGLSVRSSSLRLLRSGERAIITRINTLRDTTTQTLKVMGLTPGKTITLEQRFPRFVVRVGNHSHALNEMAINAICIRVVEQ
jgi:ferrous iron transport protein A